MKGEPEGLRAFMSHEAPRSATFQPDTAMIGLITQGERSEWTDWDHDDANETERIAQMLASPEWGGRIYGRHA